MQAESTANGTDVPSFALKADDPGASMHLRTWAKHVLYKHSRGACNDLERDRAADALIAADAMDRWTQVHKRSAG